MPSLSYNERLVAEFGNVTLACLKASSECGFVP